MRISIGPAPNGLNSFGSSKQDGASPPASQLGPVNLVPPTISHDMFIKIYDLNKKLDGPCGLPPDPCPSIHKSFRKEWGKSSPRRHA